MTEQELLIHAKSYIDKLAQGIDPITNNPVAETDIINNVRISRCLFYVSGVLDKIIKTNPSKSKKVPFNITSETIKEYQISATALSISAVAQKVNALINNENMQQLKTTSFTQFLTENGYLQREYNRTIPTSKGTSIGIISENRFSQTGAPYIAVLYNSNAQKFIIDNIDNIINVNNREKSALQNTGSLWTETEENKLKELYQQGHSTKEIANILKRTEGAISSRIEKLGLIN